MEYYCRGKKIHRMEPTKKFLLAEHKGPLVANIPPDANPTKAKYMGNLLQDESDGYISNKNFEYQVFIPSRFGNHQRLHPDSSFDKIKSNHWIKLCLRLSKMVDGKRKHYEISIDSPIHVLHKLSSHANTLLPSYDSHILANREPGKEENGNTETASQNSNTGGSYHSSNIFFPKEVVLSPMLSPNVQPLDINLNEPVSSPLPRSVMRTQVNHNHNHHSDIKNREEDENSLFTSPRLKANIYHPEVIQRELASPQAIPLSPVTSPLLQPTSLRINKPNDSYRDGFGGNDNDDLPPDFDSIDTDRSSKKIPKSPPSYADIMKSDGVESINSTTAIHGAVRVPRIILNKSQESFVRSNTGTLNLDSELENSFIDEDGNDGEDYDIASNFSFQGSSSTQNLPSGILRTHSPALRPITSDIKLGKRENIGDNLPSTTRNDNMFFNDLSQILSGDKPEKEEEPDQIHDYCPNRNYSNNLAVHNSNQSSEGGESRRSSFDRSAIFIGRDQSNMEPLLHTRSSNNVMHNIDESFQSKDSIAEYSAPPLDSSVDITALYDRNSEAWHPLQLNDPLSSPILSFSKDTNHTDTDILHHDGSEDSAVLSHPKLTEINNE